MHIDLKCPKHRRSDLCRKYIYCLSGRDYVEWGWGKYWGKIFYKEVFSINASVFPTYLAPLIKILKAKVPEDLTFFVVTLTQIHR